MENKVIGELGEKVVVEQIINSLEVPENLIHGFGHDSAFIDTKIGDDEVLLVNTDRSGTNVAYSLGLSDAKCVGDFGVSHAVSDIFASGGSPVAISVALLLPSDSTLRFVKDVMKGAEDAAKKYGAILASGDTKKNSKFAMVVTAIGKGKKNEILTRSGANAGDLLVVTGHLGTMLAGLLANRRKIPISERVGRIFTDALVVQNPPFRLSREIVSARISSACTDISDGLASSLSSICSSSGLGAIVHETKFPIHQEGINIANHLNMRPMNLTLSGGDWQYLYTVPEKNVGEIFDISSRLGHPVTVVGRLMDGNGITIKTCEGDYRELRKVENDRFVSYAEGDFFNTISKLGNVFGDSVCGKKVEEFNVYGW